MHILVYSHYVRMLIMQLFNYLNLVITPGMFLNVEVSSYFDKTIVMIEVHRSS